MSSRISPFILGSIENHMCNMICMNAIKKRETCHHWIDFEIYDALPDNLKQKYIEQFQVPRVIYFPFGTQSKWKMECKANHLDDLRRFTIDCTKCYKKTIKSIIKEFNVFKQNTLQKPTPTLFETITY